MFLPRNFRFLLALLLLIQCSAFSEDRSGGTDPLEPQFNSPESYPRELKEADLRDLPLSDPKLRVAYFWLIKTAIGWRISDDKNFPETTEILKDVRRRGDSATPLWLDMMEKNHGAWLKYSIPYNIELIGTINMEPYVDYLRKMIQTRPDEISEGACGTALGIFFEHGTEKDVEMVQKLAKKRPFLASCVESAFEREQRRRLPPLTKAPESIPTPTTDQTSSPPAPEKAPMAKPDPTALAEDSSPSMPWLAVKVMGIAAALGLLWFLIKRRS